MIPVTQFILGNSDPLLYPSEKMTNSIDEQIVVAVIKIFLMNFVNFLMHVEDEGVVVVEVV